MTSRRKRRAVVSHGQHTNGQTAVAKALAALRAASSQSLQGRLDLLTNTRHANVRGHSFEQLLFELLVEAGFRVHRNAGIARPRQSDLFAQDGHQQFLIEAKARLKPIDCADIDAMFARLARTPPDVVGMFFSLSDYTRPALEEVRRNRTREILLFDPLEVRRLVQRTADLRKLLERKRASLRRDARLWFLAPRAGSLPLRGTPLPAAEEYIAGHEGEEARRCRNLGHRLLVFAREIPDLNWNPIGGHGVGIHLRLDLETLTDLHRMLEVLHECVGLSGRGTYSIIQTDHMWYGIGATQFLKSIRERDRRYADLPASARIHHSEEIGFFDRCDDGYLLLDLRQRAASRVGKLASGQLEIGLSGVPIDTEPYERLCVEAGIRGACFVPRPATYRRHGPARARLEVVGPVNRRRTIGDDTDTVTGVVVKNPFFRKRLDEDSGGNLALSYCDELMCDLRDWHGPTDRAVGHKLLELETLQCGEYCIIRPVCTWSRILR